jgi:hydroxylamine dehydrogenase
MINNPASLLKASRLLIGCLLVVIVVLGFALIVQTIGKAGQPSEVGQVNVLANSNDKCVVCHNNATPGIVEQFGHSTMAGAKVICSDCHVVKGDYPGAKEHEGAYILSSPTVTMCQKCHQVEVAQFEHSRHALPAYVAVFGSKDLSPDLMVQFQSVPEGNFDPVKSRNAIFTLEGPAVTRFACESCHNIGKPAVDGSVGQCQKCHLRHEFSLEQARRPETCNNCHIGPDHPQWEIYQESAHGVAYATMGNTWNWDADPGTLSSKDFPAPTCAICHFSGFGGTATTHDVGDRLTWFLAAQVSARRPSWQDNKVRMQSVCFECHNKDFIDVFYADADKGVDAINGRVQEADTIIQPLQDKGLLTADPFDDPIDFVYFENWHHFGRTAKFGMWMQGADYTQWHGAYEMLSRLAELRALVQQKLDASTIPTPTPRP